MPLEEAMSNSKEFRCPFEVQGVEDKTIIEVALADEQAERFVQMRTAFERLHTDATRIAIRLTLPASIVVGCTSNEELRPRLLPYQSEVIAADLDDQLFPLLPHQEAARAVLEVLGLRLPFDESVAKLLRRGWGEHPPLSISDLAVWVLHRAEMTEGNFIAFRDGLGELALVFSESGLSVRGEAAKSSFGIVKTPFYPKAFGRYSERVEIAINRHVDVRRLPVEVQRRIRRQANEVYAAHGVRIENLDETQQPTGLWIPGEEYTVMKL